MGVPEKAVEDGSPGTWLAERNDIETISNAHNRHCAGRERLFHTDSPADEDPTKALKALLPVAVRRRIVCARGDARALPENTGCARTADLQIESRENPGDGIVFRGKNVVLSDVGEKIPVIEEVIHVAVDPAQKERSIQFPAPLGFLDDHRGTGNIYEIDAVPDDQHVLGRILVDFFDNF